MSAFWLGLSLGLFLGITIVIGAAALIHNARYRIEGES